MPLPWQEGALQLSSKISRCSADNFGSTDFPDEPEQPCEPQEKATAIRRKVPNNGEVRIKLQPRCSCLRSLKCSKVDISPTLFKEAVEMAGRVASKARFYYFQCEYWVDYSFAMHAACRAIAVTSLNSPETAV